MIMKDLKRPYKKPAMQVYELKEMPIILADSSSGTGGLNNYDFDLNNPLTW